jgi:hypothetical protein
VVSSVRAAETAVASNAREVASKAAISNKNPQKERVEIQIIK